MEPNRQKAEERLERLKKERRLLLLKQERTRVAEGEPTNETSDSSDKPSFEAPNPAIQYAKNTLRNAGRTVRSGAAAIASPLDLLSLIPNVGLAVTGNDTHFPSEYVKKGIDYITGNKLAPRNKHEKMQDVVTESVLSLPLGGGLSKVAAKKLASLYRKSGAKAQKYSHVFNPSVENVIGSGVGSALAEREMQKDNPDAALAFLYGVTGGVGATKLARGIKNKKGISVDDIKERLKSIPSRVALQAYKSIPPGTALRQTGLGDKIIEEAPERLGLSNKIRKTQPHTVTTEEGVEIFHPMGEKISTAQKEYHAAKSAHHHGLMEEIHKRGEGLYTTIEKPLHDFVHELKRVQHKKVRDDLFNSTAGKEVRAILGAKSTTPAAFFKEIDRDPSIFLEPVSVREAHGLRKGIDDLLTHKEHYAIGGEEEKRIRSLSHGIRDAYMDASEKHSPELHELWKHFNEKYSKYADVDVPKLNAIRAHKNETQKAYNATLGGLGSEGEMQYFTQKILKDPQKQHEYALSLMGEHGLEGNKFSVPKFSSKISKLNDPNKEVMLGYLDAPTKKDISHLLDMNKRLEHHLGQESFGDILARKPGLTMTSKAIKFLTRKGNEALWNNPVGRKALENELEGLGHSFAKENTKKGDITDLGRQMRLRAAQLTSRTKDEDKPLKVRMTEPGRIY